MKNLFITTIILCIAYFNSYAQATINNEKVEVIFNSKLTKADLDEIQQQMTLKNIKLEYEQLEFSYKGQLQQIAFRVDFGDGNSGNAVSRKLNANSRTGFVRYYDKQSPISCRTGYIPKS